MGGICPFEQPSSVRTTDRCVLMQEEEGAWICTLEEMNELGKDGYCKKFKAYSKTVEERIMERNW